MRSDFEGGEIEAKRIISLYGIESARELFEIHAVTPSVYWDSFRNVLAGHETATVTAQIKQPASSAPDTVEIREVNPLRQALEMYEEAFDQMFAQCCSNGVFDAWGKPVSCAKLNEAHYHAEKALKNGK